MQQKKCSTDKTNNVVYALSEESGQPRHTKFLLCPHWIAKNLSFPHGDMDD